MHRYGDGECTQWLLACATPRQLPVIRLRHNCRGSLWPHETPGKWTIRTRCYTSALNLKTLLVVRLGYARQWRPVLSATLSLWFTKRVRMSLYVSWQHLASPRSWRNRYWDKNHQGNTLDSGLVGTLELRDQLYAQSRKLLFWIGCQNCRNPGTGNLGPHRMRLLVCMKRSKDRATLASMIAVCVCKARVASLHIRLETCPPDLQAMCGWLQPSIGHSRRLCQILRSELLWQVSCYKDCLKVSCSARHGTRWQPFYRDWCRTCNESAEFLWRQVLLQLPKKKKSRAQAGKVVNLSEITIPDKHVDGLGPKFRFEPSLKRVDKRVSARSTPCEWGTN